jgi:pyruvate/2-oxoglutarate dehydrogenase complex dihydrolipoamide dehydrogenase (E3) component
VVEAIRALGRDDPELAAVVIQRLRAEGVSVLEGAKVERVARAAAGVTLGVNGADGQRTIAGSHLLVAAGRKANVEGMNLEAAGIAYSPKGIVVDARLRTTNKKVFAIGDAAGGPQFTHLAGYHAGIVLRNALFRLPAKADHSALPWVTFTDPELASVGLDENAARERAGVIRILRWPFAENDRAQVERDTDGMIKVITDKGGRILGAGIAGPHAGELIQPWILALSRRLKINAMASIIAPYPTFGEVSKRAAGGFFTPRLFSQQTRRLVRFLGRFG